MRLLCEFLDENALRTALTEQSGELDTLAVISIDGTRAGVCHNAEEAQTLLDRVKRLYTTQADSSADFVQQVHVDSVVAESRLAQASRRRFLRLCPTAWTSVRAALSPTPRPSRSAR